MGTTIWIRSYTGEVIRRGAIDVTRLLKEAQLRELPFLAGVDEYDDTIFNRRQTHTVALELVELREMTEIRNQVEDIEAAIGIVQQRPHRYLVFNGD